MREVVFSIPVTGTIHIEDDSLKVTVSEATGLFMFREKKELLKEVNNSGAVSPATLAIERRIPVRIPLAALR